MSRLAIGLVAYVALGVLAWTTLSDQRIRLVTLAILVLFAVKTWVRRKDFMHPGKVESLSGREQSGSPLAKSRAERGSQE